MGEPLPTVTPRQPGDVSGRLNDPRPLNMFSLSKVTPSQFWEDIDYLNYLYAAKADLSELGRTTQRMTQLSASIDRYLRETAKPQEIPTILNALEYVFGAADDPDKARQLYADILYIVARSLPLEGIKKRGGLARAAKLVAGMTPRLLACLHKDYVKAESADTSFVATMLADMYDWHMRRLRDADWRKHLRQQDPDDNPSEEPALPGAVRSLSQYTGR